MSSVSIAQALRDLRAVVNEGVSAKDALKKEATKGFVVERIDYGEDGVFIFYQGMEYPERSPVLAEDLFLANIAKRLFISTAKLSFRYWYVLLPVLFVPYSIKVKLLNMALDWYNHIALKTCTPIFIKDTYMTPMARELKGLLRTFLKDIGVSEQNAFDFAKIIANLINVDNAYRYRIQDIATLVGKTEICERPTRSAIKIVKGYAQREPDKKVVKKIKPFLILIALLTIHPKIRKALRHTLTTTNIKNMYPDKIDKFWMCVRDDYRFMGKTNEERRRLINTLKVCKPIKLTV